MEEFNPPGFRFYPTEEELLSFYLRHMLDGTRPELNRVIPIVDIYAVEPWDLPRMAGERCSKETEQWFFFVPQQEREMRGGKPNRTTMTGYWKATGSEGNVYSSSQKRIIGVKKTMVFYRGRAPTGRKTKWKMNEYKSLRHEMSVCRVYITSGSSRAFDRRPSAIDIQDPSVDEAPGETVPGPSTRPSLQQIRAHRPESMSSMSVSESSNSRGEDQDQNQPEGGLMNRGLGSSSTNKLDDEITIDGLEPMWEWDQLNSLNWT
ncbi:hypothetical protein V2J09_006915 [Rumex salicifolius]